MNTAHLSPVIVVGRSVTFHVQSWDAWTMLKRTKMLRNARGLILACDFAPTMEQQRKMARFVMTFAKWCSINY